MIFSHFLDYNYGNSMTSLILPTSLATISDGAFVYAAFTYLSIPTYAKKRKILVIFHSKFYWNTFVRSVSLIGEYAFGGKHSSSDTIRYDNSTNSLSST